MGSAFDGFQQAFGLGRFDPENQEAQRNAMQQKLLSVLGNQAVTQEQVGAFQPGVERPQVDSGEVRGGLLPQNQAEAVSALMTTPGTEKVGNKLLESLIIDVQSKPTNLQKNFAHLQQLRQTNPKAAAEFEKILSKPQVQINQGSKQLGANAKNWLNPTSNKKPSPLMTVEEATNAGFVPVTTAEQKSAAAGKEAAPLVASLTQIAFGDGKTKSLFPKTGTTLMNRIKGGLGSMSANLTQSDQRIVLYNRTKEAFVSSLARLAGQVGTLTDRDVGLVEGLFPTAGFTPEPIARTQFKQIVRFLKSKGVPEQGLLDLGLPKWAVGSETPALPPGFVQE